MIRKNNIFSLTDGLFKGLGRLISPLVKNREEQFRRMLSVVMGIVTIPTLLGFGFRYLRAENYVLAIFLFSNSLVFSFGLYFAKIRARMDHFFRLCLASIRVLFLYQLATSAPDGHKALWIYILPLAAFIILDRRDGVLSNTELFS